MAIPDELQMGELFGWKKGAFSGAVTDNPGCISRAERGTLFIDEIDKLSLKAQAGLLHVLEERRYRLLGEGSSERQANVRFLVGTNASLEEAVRAGRFREDLYYRINVLPLRLAPLDERTDEIPLWASTWSPGGIGRPIREARQPFPRRLCGCSRRGSGPATCDSSTTSCAEPTRWRVSANRRSACATDTIHR